MNRRIAILLSGAALLMVSGADGQTANPAAQPAKAKGIAVNPQLASKEWPTYGHDSGGMRFSPLTQITPASVATLKRVWTYDTGENSSAGYRVTPIVVGTTMYLSTPSQKIVAL